MTTTREFVPYIRRTLQEMPPKFDPPTEGYLRHQGFDTEAVRPMGLNESMFPPSPKVLEAVRSRVHMINRYPDAQCPHLTDIVTAREGVPGENIVWGNGSEELIQGTIHLSLAPGDGMVLPVPTFWGYRAMVRAAEADCAYVEMLSDGKVDIDGVLGAIGNKTRLVFCVTPNNPSGGYLDAEALSRLIDGIPENVLFGIDEAYAEFGRHAGGPDLIAMLKKRRGPWVVVRTFSKAYAMAGMRIGYAICSDGDLAQALRKTTCTFNVPILAQAAAEAALLDTEHLNKLLDWVAEGRAQITEGLKAMGLDPFPSVTNFVSVKIPVNGRDVTVALLDRGYQIHAWPDAGYENFIRITVGNRDDNAGCLVALKEVLAAA